MQRIAACLPLFTACTIINPAPHSSGDVVTGGGSESSTTPSDTTLAHDGSSSGDGSATDESSSSAAPDDDGSGGGESESSAGDTDAMQPGEILFAADFDDARFPEYGFTYEATTPGHSTITAVPGAGPQGEDVAAVDLLVAEPYQPYIGWSKQMLPATPMGELRFIRLLFRIHSPCDGVGTTDVWTDKFIILGDGLPDPWGDVARVIITLGDPIDNTLRTSIMRNIDGAEHGIPALTLECGEWHWLQWEVRSSSTIDASDGGFRVWLDGDNASYDDATGVSPAFPLVSWVEAEQANAWNNLELGYFGNTSLASGSIGFDFAAFEYGTAFDPGWHD